MTRHRHCGRTPAATVPEKNAESVGTSIPHFALDILAPRVLLLYQVPSAEGKVPRVPAHVVAGLNDVAVPSTNRGSRKNGELPRTVFFLCTSFNVDGKGAKKQLDPIRENVEHNSDRSSNTASVAGGAGSRAVPIYPLWSGPDDQSTSEEEGTGKTRA